VEEGAEVGVDREASARGRGWELLLARRGLGRSYPVMGRRSKLKRPGGPPIGVLSVVTRHAEGLQILLVVGLAPAIEGRPVVHALTSSAAALAARVISPVSPCRGFPLLREVKTIRAFSTPFFSPTLGRVRRAVAPSAPDEGGAPAVPARPSRGLWHPRISSSAGHHACASRGRAARSRWPDPGGRGGLTPEAPDRPA
jgi:hypothetical protein